MPAALLLVACAFAARPSFAQDFGALPEPPPPAPAAVAAPAAAPAPAADPGVAAPVVASQATDGATAEAGTADEAFDLKTKALEEQVNDLKEKIFRTKSRLQSLAESVLGSGELNSGAKLALWHRNELGSSYVLTSAAYTLDGAPLYTKVDETGDLNEREEFVIFDQRIVPSQHQMAVRYELRGHGYGIFSYLEGMRLKLTSSYSFNVEPGKITKITSIIREKDGITLEFKDKPDIRFEMSVQKDIGKPPGQDDAGGPQASAGGAQQ
jgi:hypothetical protein